MGNRSKNNFWMLHHKCKWASHSKDANCVVGIDSCLFVMSFVQPVEMNSMLELQSSLPPCTSRMLNMAAVAASELLDCVSWGTGKLSPGSS